MRVLYPACAARTTPAAMVLRVAKVWLTFSLLVFSCGRSVAQSIAPALYPDLVERGHIGVPLTTLILAIYDPVRYAASGLPLGLALDENTGQISGTPTVADTFVAQVSASNAAGTSQGTFRFEIRALGTPVITSQPTAEATLGAAFAYTLTATENPTTLGAENLPAGLNFDKSTGTLSGVPSQAGVYVISLSAANGVGTGFATLLLTVNDPASSPPAPLFPPPPIITGQPLGAVVMRNRDYSFSVGTNITIQTLNLFTFEWFKEGTLVARGPGFSLSSVQPADAGRYYVVVSDSNGSARSADAFIEVADFPRVTTTLMNQRAPLGGTVTFSTSATGTGPLAFVWTKNGGPLGPRATPQGSQLVITNVQAEDAGYYQVTVWNAVGSESTSAQLTTGVPPIIVTQPQSRDLALGQYYELSFSTTGDDPMTYQWFKNGQPLAGATAPRLRFDAIAASDAGTYTVRVANTSGSVTSDPAVIRVGVGPTITTPLVGRQVLTGTAFSLSVTASGEGPFRYEWSKDFGVIPGATASTLTISNAQAADSGNYTVVVTNMWGQAYSSARITVAAYPANITLLGPFSKTYDGQPLTVSATTDPPGLPVQFQYTRSSGFIMSGPPVDVGIYNVNAIVRDGSHDAMVSAELRIVAATVAVTVRGLHQVYDGLPKIVRASVPDGTPIWPEYEGAGVPREAGAYPVRLMTDDANVRASLPVNLMMVIEPSAQAVAFAPLPPSLAVGTPFSVSATSSSGLPVTLELVSGNASLSGTTLTLRDNGEVVVRASQPGNRNYQPTSETLTVSAARKTQIIAFGALPDRMLSPTPITLSAAASSGLPVSFEVVGGPATVSGNTLAFTGYEGVVIVRARQIGDATSNPAASVVRSFAVVTAQRPLITAQPVSRTILVGQDADFSIGATAPGPLFYVWMKDGEPMLFSRPIGSNYTVRNAQAWSEGSYAVAVFHGSSCVLTQPATLSLQVPPYPDAVPPVVSQITPSTALRLGDSLEISVTGAFGFGALYQWFKDGTPIPGAINSSYRGRLALGSQNRFTPGDAGTYYVVVRNSVGSVTSPTCTLSIAPGYDNVAPPLIADFTPTATTTVGGTVTLSATVLGDGLTYRWMRNGTIIAGATSGTLTIANAQSADAGAYSLFVENSLGFNNGVGGIFVGVLTGTERGAPFAEMGTGDSDPAGGATGIAPSITTQPVSGGYDPGMRVVLSVTAEGTAPLSYQWRREGVDIAGATNSTLVFASIQTSDAAFYTVQVSNAFGSTIGWARVQVSPESPSTTPRPPAITAPPQPQTVAVGGTAIFTVDVTGSQPLSFQWRKNGVPLGDGHDQTLTLRNVTLADAGEYEVAIVNYVGGVTSPRVSLTVTSTEPPPTTGAWQSQDIGGTIPAGSATVDGGTVAIRGAGADIWDTSDAFHFRYQVLSGDGTLIARVTNLERTHDWAKAGVMIRESLTPGSRYAMAMVNADIAAILQSRAVTNGTTSLGSPAWVASPVWLRLVRVGNTLTAYHSVDGVNWTTMGAVQIDLAATVYAGLAVTSHLNGTLTTATFDNVSLTGTTGPPDPLPPSTTIPAPSTLTATVMSATAVNLAWVDNYATETAIELQRSSDNTTFATVLTLCANVTSAALTGLSPATTYYFRVRATRGTDASAFSNTAIATTQPLTSPPTPPAGTWVATDIGGTAATGSSAEAGGIVTITGSGQDIWDTADEFQYRYQPWSGDGEIVVRVTSLANTDNWAKAGVMFRENLTSSARNAFIAVTPGSGAYFQSRATTGGGTALAYGSGANALPRWLRLVRAGSTFTGYESIDGATWLQVGVATLPLPASIYVGLAVTSHNDGVLCRATFDNVLFSGAGAPPSSALPAPSNLSATTSSSSVIALAWLDNSTSETSFEIERSTDNVAFVPAGTVGANVTAFSAAGLSPATRYYFRVRAVQDGIASLYSAAASAVTSGSSGSGAAWQGTDIGNVAAAGTSSDSAGVVTVNASGSDIWDTADEFHFRYQALTGDGEIIARVTSLTNTHSWAKAGVMLRESLADNSRHAFMCVTAENGTSFHRRTVTGGVTEHTSGTNSSALPRWLRLVRAGNTFTGYESAGGSTWTPVGSVVLDVPQTLYVGLAVTSHNDGVICTATFDNLALNAGTPPGSTGTMPPPPSTILAAPSNLVATAISSTQIELSWADNSDNETDFQLERSTDNVTFTFLRIERTPANTTHYSDTDLTPGTTYYYRVRAIAANNLRSGYSNTATATTLAAAPVDSAWSNSDVGAVGVAGGIETGTNTITIRGSGADIWDTSDGFRFLYRTLGGDCVVEAQVTSLTRTHPWAKAGVMIRESPAPNARNIFLCVTAENGIVLQQRQETGGTTFLAYGPGTGAPYWLRLVRSGTLVVAYVSPDGVVWSLLQTYVFPAGPALVGFAVTSHDNAQLTTAVFGDPFIQ